MTAVIFAFGGDSLPVLECVRRLVAANVRAWVFDDAAHPLPGWAQGQLWLLGAGYDRTTFSRGGNLNGTECCSGMLRAMLATDADVILKIDADTLLVNPWFFADGNVGCCSTEVARRDAFGCCYSIRRETAQAALRIIEGMRPDPYAPEDLTIWSAIRATGHGFDMIDHDPDGGGLVAVPVGAPVSEPWRFAALTFGNVPDDGWRDRGLQVSQEMRRFRAVLDEVRVDR